MACKPGKAMERFLGREDYWLEARTPDELAGKLTGRYGGNFDAWQMEVKDAITCKSLIPETKQGKRGYRTQNSNERSPVLTTLSASLSGNVELVF
ncbi:MAG: hypothetical protein EOT05_00285 [Candidatus Microsaccharimonas sossegonensis]|uniref:Uncharacterized protein n=1 Tax=Candidatus Microsaccharimonas sossegonensis TaxID=2506948 RepID=A0A4Q0AGU0_9BACT|nr:MAG: hypothetical protein EOT05_00285 [Candidatus Microsaccharimonas sossegonensis]